MFQKKHIGVRSFGVYSASVLAALLWVSGAAADVRVVGALGNFDVYNTTPEPCDEMEIELEGPQPEHISGYWRNYNYGLPTCRPNATGTGVIIRYANPLHPTSIGSVEHYGIHFIYGATVPPITRREFRWLHNGVVVAYGPGQAPVPVPMPVVNLIPATEFEPAELVEAVEVEPENTQSTWMRRSTIVVAGAVQLEQLMTVDPLIQSAISIDVEEELLHPGETMNNNERIEWEAHDNPGLLSAVISIETFRDIATFNPATGQFDHVRGELVSTSMNAVVLERTPCEQRPVITLQPLNETVSSDGSAEQCAECAAVLESDHRSSASRFGES